MDPPGGISLGLCLGRFFVFHVPGSGLGGGMGLVIGMARVPGGNRMENTLDLKPCPGRWNGLWPQFGGRPFSCGATEGRWRLRET